MTGEIEAIQGAITTVDDEPADVYWPPGSSATKPATEPGHLCASLQAEPAKIGPHIPVRAT